MKAVKKSNIEERLMQYSEETHKLTPSRREEKLLELLTIAEERRIGSGFWEFAKGQLGILGRFSLLWELGWLAMFFGASYYFRDLPAKEFTLPLISILSPFLLIIFAMDIGRITGRGILEIEAAAKYSLPQVLLFKGLVYEIMQLAVILLAGLLCRNSLGLPLGHAVLYGYTPLIFSGTLLLFCVSRFRGRSIQYAGMALTVATVALLMFLDKAQELQVIAFSIFAPENLWVWSVALVLSAAVYLLELVFIGKGVGIDDIGTMRSVEML